MTVQTAGRSKGRSQMMRNEGRPRTPENNMIADATTPRRKRELSCTATDGQHGADEATRTPEGTSTSQMQVPTSLPRATVTSAWSMAAAEQSSRAAEQSGNANATPNAENAAAGAALGSSTVAVGVVAKGANACVALHPQCHANTCSDVSNLQRCADVEPIVESLLFP